MYRVALASLHMRLSSCVCLSADLFQLRFCLRLRCYIFTIEKVRLLSSCSPQMLGAQAPQSVRRTPELAAAAFSRGGVSDTAYTACIWYPKPVACPRSTSGRSPKLGRSPNCGKRVCRLSCGLPKKQHHGDTTQHGSQRRLLWACAHISGRSPHGGATTDVCT